MALVIEGKSTCPICGKTIDRGQPIVAFPAFLPRGHLLQRFSDAAMHQDCFGRDSNARIVQGLYDRFRAVWTKRPRTLRGVLEMDKWGVEAFGALWREDGFRVDVVNEIVDRPLRFEPPRVVGEAGVRTRPQTATQTTAVFRTTATELYTSP